MIARQHPLDATRPCAYDDPNNKFCLLPAAVLFQIAELLLPREFVAFIQTCRFTYKFFTRDSSWLTRYKQHLQQRKECDLNSHLCGHHAFTKSRKGVNRRKKNASWVQRCFFLFVCSFDQD